ncbi:MAG: hypothetical protein IOD12_00775 [Silvanigrellales bacterium]|jgi:signal transduction histidine kinase|nr:hypothetical protein [Silvanigrellales bacterium]
MNLVKGRLRFLWVGCVVATLLAVSLALLSLIPTSKLHSFGVDVEVAQEVSGPISLEQALSLPDTAWVSARGRQRLKYGHSDVGLWVRFQVPKGIRSQPFLILFDNTHLHDIQFFAPRKEGGHRTARWGVALARTQWTEQTPKPLFTGDPAQDAVEKTFYLRIKSPTPFSVDPLVIPTSIWQFSRRSGDALETGVLGSILMAALLALTSAIARQEREHFLLGAYCLFSFLTFWTFSGLIHLTPIGNITYLGPRLPYVCGGSTMVLFLVLCRRTLGLSFRTTPVLQGIFCVLVAGTSGTILLSLLEVNAFTEKVSNAFGGVSSFFGLFAGIALLSKEKKAFLFLASQSVFAFGVIGFVLALQGIIPPSQIAKNLFGMGSALSVCILTFSLRDELFRLNDNLLKRSRALEAEVEARLRVQTELEQRTLEMAQISYQASLGELAAGISHEIRNPLATIAFNAQMLASLVEEEAHLPASTRTEFQSNIGITVRNVERITRILDALKKLSWREGSKNDSVVSLRETIQAVSELALERLKSFGVELRLELPPGRHMAKASDTAVAQILINLLNNACDAIAPLEERWVQVRLESTATDVKIYVTDSGHGIPDALADKVMRPFFTTKEAGKGTGLGLSLSRRFAEAHGGSLVLLRPCERTCFVLTLPSSEAAYSQSATPRVA